MCVPKRPIQSRMPCGHQQERESWAVARRARECHWRREPVIQSGAGVSRNQQLSPRARVSESSIRRGPTGGHPWFMSQGGLEMDVLVDRCAGLDVHKDTVMAVVRRPTPDGTGREQEVRQYRTFTAALRELRAWLVAERVSQVAMEATGSYW